MRLQILGAGQSMGRGVTLRRSADRDNNVFHKRPATTSDLPPNPRNFEAYFTWVAGRLCLYSFADLKVFLIQVFG